MLYKFIINLLCLITIAFCVLPGISRAQFKAVQLCNESRELDGGARLSKDDVSRSYLRLAIPKGTAGIIYSITTNDSGDAADAGLLSQVNALLPRYKSINATQLSAIADSVKLPKGNAPVNIYIADAANEVSRFMTYSDDSWNYKAVRYQIAAGTSSIDTQPFKSNTLFLCVSNTLERQRVSIHVEAVAIVAE